MGRDNRTQRKRMERILEHEDRKIKKNEDEQGIEIVSISGMVKMVKVCKNSQNSR